jgi:hypothetical protein
MPNSPSFTENDYQPVETTPFYARFFNNFRKWFSEHPYYAGFLTFLVLSVAVVATIIGLGLLPIGFGLVAAPAAAIAITVGSAIAVAGLLTAGFALTKFVYNRIFKQSATVKELTDTPQATLGGKEVLESELESSSPSLMGSLLLADPKKGANEDDELKLGNNSQQEGEEDQTPAKSPQDEEQNDEEENDEEEKLDSGTTSPQSTTASPVSTPSTLDGQTSEETKSSQSWYQNYLPSSLSTVGSYMPSWSTVGKAFVVLLAATAAVQIGRNAFGTASVGNDLPSDGMCPLYPPMDANVTLTNYTMDSRYCYDQPFIDVPYSTTSTFVDSDTSTSANTPNTGTVTQYDPLFAFESQIRESIMKDVDSKMQAAKKVSDAKILELQQEVTQVKTTAEQQINEVKGEATKAKNCGLALAGIGGSIFLPPPLNAAGLATSAAYATANCL